MYYLLFVILFWVGVWDATELGVDIGLDYFGKKNDVNRFIIFVIMAVISFAVLYHLNRLANI